jgi:two-component system chemotaxis sensor kinase CheA
MVADEQLQERLRALFLEELEDGLQLLGQGLLSLEESSGHGASRAVVQELFRAAHSLKGAAHAAGVPEAVARCDRLESAFAALRDGDQLADPALVTQLLAETDALTALAEHLQRGVESTATTGQITPLRPSPDPPPATDAALAAQPAPSVRITADKIDDVLRQAGEGLAASRRLHELADEAAAAAELVDGARTRLRAAMQDGNGLPERLETLLDEASRTVTGLARAVAVTDRSLHHASSGVADAVQRLRTQPFEQACSSLDRVVRDIATATGKSARLLVVGGEVDVDRSVITALRDPLLHLVRNAVDHGLETPDVRKASGKPTTGTVEVLASLEGSLLRVTVRDDGGGIDAARLRAAAARRGLTLPTDDPELAFTPGLSCRDDVTDVSGRGVGLDAARARLEQLGGSLEITSTAGSGTQAHLTTPVSLAVLRVLLVRAGEQLVALPSAAVDRVVQVERQQLREVEGAVLLPVDGRNARAVALAEAVGLPAAATELSQQARLGVVVPRGGDAVLVTDGLLDELEVAVQPVPVRLAGTPGVLGIAILPSGQPALAVNPVAVGRHAAPLAMPRGTQPHTAAPRILLAEDTVTTRALERSILEAAGYSVSVAVDGVDAWEQLQADGADLVVSDVDMPRMSGFELCRRIRGSAQLRDLPVVLVTSLDSAADRQRGLEAGADAYVVKAEFQQGTLLDTLARLL